MSCFCHFLKHNIQAISNEEAKQKKGTQENHELLLETAIITMKLFFSAAYLKHICSSELCTSTSSEHAKGRSTKEILYLLHCTTSRQDHCHALSILKRLVNLPMWFKISQQREGMSCKEKWLHGNMQNKWEDAVTAGDQSLIRGRTSLVKN